MGDDRILDKLASAICDGAPVDWDASEAVAEEPAAREMIRQLRVAASVARARHAAPRRAAADTHVFVAVAYRLVVAAAALKLLAALPGYSLRLSSSNQPAHWPHIAILLTFALTGCILLWGGVRDTRSRYLGALFVMVASAFANRGLIGFAAIPALAPAASVLRGVTTEGFLAYALWAFVTAFPRSPERSRDVAIAGGFRAVAFAVGLVLLLANVCLKLGALGLPLPGGLWVLALFDRSSPNNVAFWPTQFAIAVPALPYLLWRSRFEAFDDRGRVAMFAVSLVAGIAPILAVVMLSPFIPFFDDPLNRRWLGVILYGSLLCVVPATAYAVLVHRVMDVELIIRKTLQHRLARYGVWLLVAMPVLGLIVHVYTHRHLSVSELVSEVRPLALLPVLAMIGVALGAHRRILRAIDRRFLRETPDYPRVLANLEQQMRYVSGVEEAGTLLARDTDRAIHPAVVAVLLHDEREECLLSVGGVLPPLPVDATLCRILAGARQEIQVGAGVSALAQLLPQQDRNWLSAGGIHLLVPLVGPRERLVGAVALGEKRNQAPYSPDDRMLLLAMAGQAATTMENVRLRSQVEQRRAGRARAAGTDQWVCDEPAAACGVCRAIWPSSTRFCACGGATSTAVLPLLVEGKFQLERVLGAGGMGLVYLAVDISLGRRVAIKTLPRLTAERAARLRREARAMAKVQHPNLATIYGIEEWRGRPLLVVEYLEGGTLAGRLRRERLSPAQAITLGVVLADVLERVHASRLLHRDIKPSNIAFTGGGVAKLLDFGLASIAADQEAAMPEPADAAAVEAGIDAASGSSGQHMMGTLAYLSPDAVVGGEPDASFDLWSVSVVLYECIAGVHPLASASGDEMVDRIRRAALPDIRRFRPDCPEPVASFLSDSLALSRDRRPRTAGELRSRCQYLRAILAHKPF